MLDHNKDWLLFDNMYVVYPEDSVELDIPFTDQKVQAHWAWAVEKDKLHANKDKMVDWAKTINWTTARKRQDSKVVEKIIKNDPFSIKVIGYETRMQSIVYKVVTDHNPGLVFDFQLEIMDYCLFKYKIDKGSIDAKFVFSKAKRDKKMRIIPTDFMQDLIIKDILL